MATKKASPAKPKGKSGKTKKGPAARHVYRKGGQPYPLEFRLKAIQEVAEWLRSRPRQGGHTLDALIQRIAGA